MSIIDGANQNSITRSVKNALFATMKPAAKGSKAARSTWTQLQLKLITIIIVLNLFGIAMILSAGSVVASQEGIGEFSYAIKQTLWFLIGLTVLYFFAKFDYRNLKALAQPLLYLTYFMMFLLYTPLGVEGGGATRWISLFGITVQPSEILKLGTVLFTAKIVSDYQNDLRNSNLYVIPSILTIPAIMMLLTQPDYGTMCLVLFLLGTILYLGGMPLDKFFKFGIILTPLLMLGAIAAPYRRKRLLAVINPEGDALNSGWQTLQSLTGISNGGLLGVGPGSSKSKWWTPETHTDFIFTVIAEEMGLFGSLVVLFLFGAIVTFGVQIAKNSNDKFGYLTAMGITSWFAVQAIVNIGVTIGQLPNTGLPLPFISYGGSSLLIGMAATGIMLNIAYQSKK